MAIEEILRSILTATPAKRRELERVLRGEARTETTGKADEDRRLVTIAGAARLLALGRNTVYRLIETGRLDTVDLNGVKRITMRSIHAFVSGGRPANEKTAALIAASKARYAADKSDGEEAK